MARIPLQIASRGLDTGPMVNYSGVSRSPVGQVLQGFGGELQGMSSQLAAIEERRRTQREEVENFETMQQLDRMELAVQGDLAQVQQNTPASGMGYHDNALTTFEKKQQEFLANVPERLKPRLSSILETKRMEFSQKQAQAELELRQGWYRDGVKEKQESLQNQVFNDPTTFANAREEGLLAIEASGLPEIEKTALRESWDETLALTLGEREVRDAEADPDNSIAAAARLGVTGANTTDNGGDAMSLLREFEGFRETPYWDKTALRTGYGSDTTTRADGSVVRVTASTRVSRADAERDLARRAKDFENTARGQVGAREWGALSPQAQAALVSVAYNYGRLPGSVVNAVKGGDTARIAQAVEGLGGHNGGINRGRRSREAAIIRGGASITGNAPAMDERYAALSLDKRLEIFDRTQAAAGRARTAFAAQEKALYDEHKGSLELGIETGQIASERTILSDPMLTDAHKADLLASFKTKMADQLATQQAVAAFSQGALVVDPYSTDGRKAVDRVYDALTKTADPEQVQSATENLISTTGVVPAAYHNQIRAGLESQNLAEVEASAARAARINAINPAILERREGGAEIQKMADQYDYLVNTRGMSSADAAKRMVESRTRDFKTNEAVLGPAADKLMKDLSVGDITGEFATGIFGFGAPGAGVDPTTENSLLSEYREAFREEFILSGGDEAIARAAAIGSIKKTWGESTVSGERQLMKYPPERFYPAVGNSHAYLETDMRATASELALDGESADVLGRVWLRPSPATAADIRAGRPPRYRMFYEYSVNDQLIVDEAPGFWAMPSERIEESRASARQQQMQDAEATRDFMSDRQEVPADQRMDFIEQEERINRGLRGEPEPTDDRLPGEPPISRGSPQPLPPLPERPMTERQLGSTRTPEQIRAMSSQMLQDFRGTR